MQAQGDCKNVVQRPSHSLIIQVIRLVLGQLVEIPTSVRSFLDSMVRVLWTEKEWVVGKAEKQ